MGHCFENKDLIQNNQSCSVLLLQKEDPNHDGINLQMREVVRMANSVFADVETAPPIEVFQLGRDFAADTNPKKVPHPLLETLTSSITWRTRESCCFWSYSRLCNVSSGEPGSWSISDVGGETMDSAGGQESGEDSCQKGEQSRIEEQTRTFVLMDSIHWIAQ